MLIEKYNALSQREQWILKIAVPLVAIMMLWLIAIKPILDTDTRLHKSLAGNQQKLQWMQQNAAAIATTDTTEKNPAPTNKSQLRQVMNQALKAQNISVERIQNINQTDISYRFDNTNFNSVLALLSNLEQRGIKVVQLQISKSKKVGMVNTRLSVASGS